MKHLYSYGINEAKLKVGDKVKVLVHDYRGKGIAPKVIKVGTLQDVGPLFKTLSKIKNDADKQTYSWYMKYPESFDMNEMTYKVDGEWFIATIEYEVVKA